MRTAQSIIVRPVMTEKTRGLMEATREDGTRVVTLAFIVDRNANKIEIRNAVESLFAVKVDGVRVVRVPSRIRKVGRSIGRSAVRKKAYVKLVAGQNPPAIFEV